MVEYRLTLSELSSAIVGFQIDIQLILDSNDIKSSIRKKKQTFYYFLKNMFG